MSSLQKRESICLESPDRPIRPSREEEMADTSAVDDLKL
jgi:hypothetical protein